MNENDKKMPTFLQSLTPLIAIAVLLGIGYGVLKLNAEILLIAAAVVAGVIAFRLGYSYREIESGIIESMMKAMPAMLIVIVVGALIGSWIAAGTIPMLVYYGLQAISPKFFLVTACLVCSFISVVTGTSYGTVGTIGVAFIGIAHGLNIPAGQAAGAIVAGAYFGDKISPFSDTTNLAPIAAKSNLFDHIRHTLWTTTPAWVLGMVVYFFLGMSSNMSATVSLEKTELMMNLLQANFKFHCLLLVPPILTLYFAIRKQPVIPGMLISATVAVVLAIFIQGNDLKTAVKSLVTGFESATGDKLIDTLLTRGGMASMMDVTLIAFCAFAFGGIVQKARMLEVLLDRLLRVANTTGKIIAATVSACIATALMTGSSFLSILIPGELFAPAYKKYNLAAKNLSRTTEDSGTVVVPLVPWSIAGVFMSGTLGVATIDYAKWAVMCYTGFIIAIIYGFTGFAIAPKIREDETLPGS
ncbi:Na+/H+ antiporter NhaC [candidate division KSB1 bacterium]|nr:Na+/H+ antiporter NhaC [candidate division KSB1 bacterium]